MMKWLPAMLVLAIVTFSACGGDDDDDRNADDDDASDDDDAVPDDDSDDDGDDDLDDDLDDDAAPAPPPGIAIPCEDSKNDVYVTPGGLPPFDETERGAIVRCYEAESADAAEVSERLVDAPGLTVTSGYRAYLIAYRTERADGVAGVGVARLLVPTEPQPGPLPIVSANHGTAGLADFCALSKFKEANDELLLPWVAAGYVAVGPDYAGLGNEGTQGYGHNADTAHSIFDAARAAIRALTPGSVEGRLIVAGHSQGGGASLSVRAYAPDYAQPDLTLEAVVSFAGEYSTDAGLDAFRYPWFPITGGAGVTRAVVALALYADFANLFGEDRAGEPFNADVREHIVEAIETKCVHQLAADLATADPDYTPPNTVGEIGDAAFADEVVACLDGQPGCTERAEDYIARNEENGVPMQAEGAPVLMISGLDDIQQTPESQACALEQLQEWGVDVASCAFEGLDHEELVAGAVAYAVDWVFDHDAPCPSTASLPACSD